MAASLFFTACKTGQKSDEGLSDFSGTLSQAEIDKGRLTPELLWKFGRVSDGVISPNGESVAYSVTRYNAETEDKTSNIFVIPYAGGEAKKITEDRFRDMAPVWIEGGKKMAFLSNRMGDYQVWTMFADGTGREQLTKIEGGINAFKFSPDESKLLYLKNVKLEQSVTEQNPDLPKANAIAASDLMYRHWDSWDDHTFSHIFFAEIDGVITEGTDIMEGEKWDSPLSPFFDESEVSWAPDSKTIAYTSKKLYGKEAAISTNSDIFLYHIEEGKTENITSANRGYDKYPVFSPSGNKIAWMRMEKPGNEADKERLMVMDLSTRQESCLNEKWDRNAHPSFWSEDEKELYFITGDEATFQLYKVDVASKKFTALTKGQHNLGGLDKVGAQIVLGKTTHQMAKELFTYDEESASLKQLTFENKQIYDHINMGHTEAKWVKTTDGKDMKVWVVYPPNFDPNKKYPALLYCQGGPQSAVSQFFSYRWNFSMMAANDYIIVAPNRRGLPSFGEEWNAQISLDYAGQNIQDYLSAIDALKTEDYIDEDRLGCVGASYGGYSTFFLAGHHEKRFKAFISHCGMFNLESFYAATEETFFPNNDLGGAYWELDNKAAQKSFAHSPHKYVQNWDTPILIITGGKDFRIPYTESLQAFNAAQLQGVPSRLLYFPEESHWVLHPQNGILWQREFFSWLDTYLK